MLCLGWPAQLSFGVLKGSTCTYRQYTYVMVSSDGVVMFDLISLIFPEL